MPPTVGIITPGAMGASVAAAALGNCARVGWASAGRSPATLKRALDAGLTDFGDHRTLVAETDIIFSVCPPHLAGVIAGEIADLGFGGLYVEGNAISPARTRTIAATLAAGGATVIDGGIIGGPAWRREAGTRLYLSGEASKNAAALFDNSPLEAIVISEQIGAASALKMSFAAYTKGTTALLTAILAVAENEGVRADLERQWGEAFTTRTHTQVAVNTAKAWRFAGEMREIAATFEGAGLPGGFHSAAAEVFDRLATFKDQPQPGISAVLEQLSGER